jgi:hypothetical protein
MDGYIILVRGAPDYNLNAFPSVDKACECIAKKRLRGCEITQALPLDEIVDDETTRIRGYVFWDTKINQNRVGYWRRFREMLEEANDPCYGDAEPRKLIAIDASMIKLAEDLGFQNTTESPSP